MIVGLTGKYCSGKNIAGRIFSDRGWDVLDIDKFGHDALLENASEIIETFGTGIADESGGVDRKKLGSLVFGDKNQLARLESIIHPGMVDRCRRYIEASFSRNILINAAILHHMGLNRLCNSVLWIESSLLIRFRRALNRDKLSFFQIVMRIFRQRKLDAKYWGEDVDIHIIRNNSTRGSLEVEVNSLIEEYEKRV